MLSLLPGALPLPSGLPLLALLALPARAAGISESPRAQLMGRGRTEGTGSSSVSIGLAGERPAASARRFVAAGESGLCSARDTICWQTSATPRKQTQSENSSPSDSTPAHKSGKG